MKLSQEDVELFYKLHPALLVYVNQRLRLVPSVKTIETLLPLAIEKKGTIRQALYEHADLIDDFVQENPDNFAPDELAIVRSWKHFVQGQFYLFRYLKKHAIFLDADASPKAYGVLAISDSFDEFFPYPPVMVEAVLLPFKQHIIYDGMLLPYNIRFGSGIRRRLNDSYQQAKAQCGIITTLPFGQQEETYDDSEQLKFYLRSERNRAMYWDEIATLIDTSASLRTLYHQEMGRIHARTSSKRLRELGLTGVWFAMLEGLTIASGKTKADVERLVRTIVPQPQRPFVYTFQVKETGKRARAQA